MDVWINIFATRGLNATLVSCQLSSSNVGVSMLVFEVFADSSGFAVSM